MVAVEPPEGWVPPQAPTETAGPARQGASAGDAVNQPRENTKSSQPPGARGSNQEHSPGKRSSAKRRERQPAPEDLQETLPGAGEEGWGDDLRLEPLTDRPSPADALLEQTGSKDEQAAAGSGRSAKGGNAPQSAGKIGKTPSIGTATDWGNSADWDSARTKRRRTVLLAIIGGLGAVLILSLLTFYFLNGSGRTDPQMADADQKQKRPVDDPRVQAPSIDDPQANISGSDDGAANDGENSPPNNPAAGEPSGLIPPTGQNPGQNPALNPGVTDPANPATDDSGVDLSETNGPSGNPTETGDAASGSEPDAPATPLAGIGATADDPQEDASFAAVMQDIFGADELTSDWDDPGLRDLQNSTGDPIDDVLRTVAQKEPPRRRSARFAQPEPRQVDVARTLSAKMTGFRSEGFRLPQLLALCETLTSVPVWIDLNRYAGTPTSLDRKETIEALDVTVPELLQQSLPTYEFLYEESAWDPRQPELTGLRVFPAGSELMTLAQYPIPWVGGEVNATLEDNRSDANATPDPQRAEQDPLAAAGRPNDPLQADPGIGGQGQLAGEDRVADPELVQLVGMIQQYSTPGMWVEVPEEFAGPLEEIVTPELGAVRIVGRELEVFHFPHVHAKIAKLIAQIQLSRAAQVDVRQWPVELQPLAVSGGDRLQTIVTIERYQPEPLHEIIRRIYEQSDVTVLVDWPSLIPEGWTPDTKVPLVARNVMVEDLLRELCLDMGLVLRVIAPNVVALVSERTEDRMADLEIYPVQDLLPQAQQWPMFRNRLKRLLEQEMVRYPQAYIYYEPAHGALVARLPQASQRRLLMYLEAARKMTP